MAPHFDNNTIGVLSRAREYKGYNINYYHQTNDLFRKNIKFLIRQNGFRINKFCELIAEAGIKYRSSNLHNFSKNRRSFLNVLHVVTFARLFNVDPGLLISVDLADLHYRDHPDQAPEKWRELHPEFYEGG